MALVNDKANSDNPLLDQDERVEVKKLFSNLKKALPTLTDLLRECDYMANCEDRVYWFYHRSWKAYDLQHTTIEIMRKLQELYPEKQLNKRFMRIVRDGTGKTCKKEDNKRWLQVTRPIVEAFFHAHYFLAIAVKCGQELQYPPKLMPSGWASLLCLYRLSRIQRQELRIIHQQNRWLSFITAREFARSLHLKSKDNWNKYIRGEYVDIESKPTLIPARPDYVYKKEGWVCWPDWLGTSYISPRQRTYLSYDEAKKYSTNMNIKTSTQYRKFWNENKPIFLPSHPERYYANKGWKAWRHFLDTRQIKNIPWLSFQEARRYVRRLRFKSSKEFITWCGGKLQGGLEKPTNIPRHPELIYKDWRGYPDFLGCKTIAPKKRVFFSFYHAKDYVQKEGIRSRKDYVTHRKQYKVALLPSDPYKKYKNAGWTDWPDFLGIPKSCPDGWQKYERAEGFVHPLRLRSHKQWLQYCRGEFNHLPLKPKDIPMDPYRVYAGKGWRSWGQWLGNSNTARRNIFFRKFESARSFAIGLKLSNEAEWKQYAQGKISSDIKKPADIPSSPNIIYRGRGWKGWMDFLRGSDLS